MTTLRLILWNHLSSSISSLKDVDKKKDIIVFLETIEETKHVNHHVKKLAFLLSAMRHFAKELEEKGFQVLYVDLEKNEPSLTSGISKIIKKTKADRIVVTESYDFRTLKEIQSWKKKFKLLIEIRPDDRFFISTHEFQDWARGKKKLLMENFYEMMRKKTGYLLNQNGSPKGGQWNFDEENRNPISSTIHPKAPFQVKPDAITKQVLTLVKERFSKNFGDLLPFWFATTAEDAKHALDHFIHNALPLFGTYQDAMSQEESFLYHSILSHYINAGLLDPRLVCDAVEKAYTQKKVPIQSAEGFIRQILGWREYIRGVYWLKMPKLATQNFFNAKRKLPWFYWDGKTEMNCLKQAIDQTKKHAYSHHIQRLMITGNFALLAGVDPKDVSYWYLSVYADAHEWVELPNTVSMSQFADGGFLATKPYISSGNYINKMSNFCKNCAFDVNQKEGKKACPFNYLYWDFLIRNQKKLAKNIRLKTAYQMLKRFSASKKKQIRQDALSFLKTISDQNLKS